MSSPIARDVAVQSQNPGASILNPAVPVNTDLGRALRDMHHSLPHYHQAANYYGGNIPELFASIRLRRAMARTGMGFRFNFAKTPVDALTDRLEIASITSSDDNVNGMLADLWEDNQLDLEAPEIHRRAGEYGDAYVIVWPVEEAPDNGPEPVVFDDVQAEEVIPNVGIYFNSPETCRMFYDPENPLKKRMFAKRWQLPDTKQWRIDLMYADRIERYISLTGEKGDKQADYVAYRDAPDEEWPLVNPFGAIPAFHFRNDRPYGCPEHQGFYGPQDSINKLIISHMAGVDYQTFPQRYALVSPDSDTSEAADLDEDEYVFPLQEPSGATTSTANLGGEGRAQLTSDPGSVWYMRGVTGVGQFAVADPDVFLKPMERYLRFGAQITTTPLRMFDYEASQMPSGQSQSQADGPFVKKVRHRQMSYGATWRDVFEFALHVIGIEDVDVQVNWAPAHVVDDKAGWETVAIKLAAGVPFEQVMREAGYTDAELEGWAMQHAAQQQLQGQPPAQQPPVGGAGS